MLVIAALAFWLQQPGFDELAARAQAVIDSDPAAAVQLYDQALAIRPDWADGWMYLGAADFKLGRYEDARKALRRGCDLAPGRGTPIAFLGMAEYELGQKNNALRDLLKGEEIGLANDPEFMAAVHYRAAMIYLRSSDFVGAMQQLQPLARAGIKNDQVVHAMGLMALKRSHDSVEDKELIDAAGAAVWGYERQVPEAGDLLRNLVNRFPNAPHVHYLYGVSVMKSDPATAEREFRRELEIAPQDGDAHAQLATLLLRQGDNANALENARSAVHIRSDDPWYQAVLGRVLLAQGDISGALRTLQQAERLGPASAMTHYYLLQAYRRAGKTADAEREKAEWDRLRAARADKDAQSSGMGDR